MTVRAWRRAAVAIEGRPQIDIKVPDRRRYWVYGWNWFPESLRQDCHAWCDRLAGLDLLEDAPFRPVRPVPLAHREWQIRSFASALVRMGHDPAMLTCLKDLIEIDAFISSRLTPSKVDFASFSTGRAARPQPRSRILPAA